MIKIGKPGRVNRVLPVFSHFYKTSHFFQRPGVRFGGPSHGAMARLWWHLCDAAPFGGDEAAGAKLERKSQPEKRSHNQGVWGGKHLA